MIFETPIKHVDNLFNFKIKYNDLDDKSKKSINIHLLFRCISMNIDYIEVINDLQYLRKVLSVEKIYNLLIDILPNQKYFSFTYINNLSKKIDSKLAIKYFVDYFDCSEKEAELYIDTLIKTKQTNIIKELLSYYIYEESIISDILKQLNTNK